MLQGYRRSTTGDEDDPTMRMMVSMKPDKSGQSIDGLVEKLRRRLSSEVSLGGEVGWDRGGGGGRGREQHDVGSG